MTETLRERVRERLADIILLNCGGFRFKAQEAADAILREFRLQPVAVGRVAGDDSEVTPL